MPLLRHTSISKEKLQVIKCGKRKNTGKIVAKRNWSSYILFSDKIGLEHKISLLEIALDNNFLNVEFTREI